MYGKKKIFNTKDYADKGDHHFIYFDEYGHESSAYVPERLVEEELFDSYLEEYDIQTDEEADVLKHFIHVFYDQFVDENEEYLKEVFEYKIED